MLTAFVHECTHMVKYRQSQYIVYLFNNSRTVAIVRHFAVYNDNNISFRRFSSTELPVHAWASGTYYSLIQSNNNPLSNLGT